MVGQVSYCRVLESSFLGLRMLKKVVDPLGLSDSEEHALEVTEHQSPLG